MADLKIFLDERYILLSENDTESEAEGTLIIGSSGDNDKKRIKEAFERFERDISIKKLLIKGIGDIRKICEICGFTYVQAAGGKVLNEKGEILVIFRYGRWDLPKGKMKNNEMPKAAALREVEEETGLKKIKALNELPSTYHLFGHSQNRILKQTYWFEMYSKSDQPLVPQKEEDISIAKWVSGKEISVVVRNTYASLREMVRI